MKHAREDYQRIQDPYGKIPEEEPVLLLRAQDEFAWMAASHYANLCAASGHQKPEDVARLRDHVMAMCAWPTKKKPDLPETVGGVPFRMTMIFDSETRSVQGVMPAFEDLSAKLAEAQRERDEARALNVAWQEKAATWMASPEAAQRLQGYRDLGQRVAQAQNERDALRAEVERLRGALQRIEKWFGEFPTTGKYWDEPDNTRPMSYASAFGSNGERDYMRGIARAALQGPTPLSADEQRVIGKAKRASATLVASPQEPTP